MRNFIPGITDAIQKESFTYFFLLDLELDSVTYRLTDADVPIFHGGERYIPTAFQFVDIASSSHLAVENIEIEIDDTELGLLAVVLGEDVRNKWFILSFAVLDESVVHTQELMRGFIGGWEAYDDSILRITITNELVLWDKRPLRVQQSSCPWVFRGPECGYSGAGLRCDQTYEQCKAHENTDNFGGYRFLNAMMEREIWWGRTQKL